MSGNGELGNEYALSEEELAEVRSYRESYEIETTDVRAIGLPPDGLSEEQLAALSDADIRGMISPQARELVVIQEIGSRAAYDRKYKHPEWPGAQSGVTIGIGYDIGQSGLEDFTRSWQDKLPADAFERLAQTVGVIGPAARPLPRTLQDIEVPWDAAEEVFTNFTAPKYARLVLRHLANAADLHPHAFGALFSLVYNRGASFGNPGDRYREMRNIRGHMHERKFDLVPEEFRAMKRLWQGQSLAGLLKRRDLEAALFVQGLSAPPISVAPAPEPAPVPEPTPVPAAAPTPAPVSAGAAATPPSDLVEPVPAPQPVPAPAPEPAARTIRRALRIAPEADEDWITLERAVERGLEAAPATRGGPSYTANDVSWSADDKNPEYRHLDKTLADREFSFSAKELELVIGASYFQPSRENGVILFGLRGAELVGGPSQINQDVLRLRDARPDHRAFRCVIGAYHVGRQQLSAFIGSTVPNNGSVHTNWARHMSGGAPYGNMLLTGCYRYKVGTHVGGVEVPGAFRLQEDDEVVVLRSNVDVSYDTQDHWDPCVPHDNLHPSFRSMSFSSAGCQTVRGTYTGQEHTGEWGQFRKAVGLGSSDNGKRFDYVLITGLEAAIAAKTLAQGAGDPALVQTRLARIRYGSQGDAVKRLQAALQRPQTGFFNADDKVALAALQREKLGFADGVYAPEMDAKLGFDVFTAPVAVAALETAARSLAPTTRVALVIGNGAYQNPGARLVNPANDAQVVSAELEKLGFRVNLLVDKTREEMSEAISLFIDRLNSTEVNADTGLIFYAGHGVQIDGENYLLPTNVQARNVVSLIDSSLSLDNLIRQLERTKKAGLIFLDCCRNNPFPAATRALGGGLAKIDAPAGIFIAFSTAPGAVALDGEDTANSPFTSSLISHLPSAGISVSQMMIRVRRDVFDKSSGRQMPWDSSSLLIDFAFNPTRAGTHGAERTAVAGSGGQAAAGGGGAHGGRNLGADQPEQQRAAVAQLRDHLPLQQASRRRRAAAQAAADEARVYRASKFAAASSWWRYSCSRSCNGSGCDDQDGENRSRRRRHRRDPLRREVQPLRQHALVVPDALRLRFLLVQSLQLRPRNAAVLHQGRLSVRADAASRKSRPPTCGGYKKPVETPFIIYPGPDVRKRRCVPAGRRACAHRRHPRCGQEEFDAEYNAWGLEVERGRDRRHTQSGHCLPAALPGPGELRGLHLQYPHIRRCKLFHLDPPGR